MAGHDNGAIFQLRGAIQAGCARWRGGVPADTAVRAELQGAAKAQRENPTIAQGEQFVDRGLSELTRRVPVLAAVSGTVQLTAFTRHQQCAVRQPGDRVEVQAIRIVQSWLPGPVEAAIAGVQDHPVGTDNPAFTGVAKPHIEQGP
ncbi:hypothetical protein D3C76_1529120 [compost metagenome]